jgi:hypothetical protein
LLLVSSRTIPNDLVVLKKDGRRETQPRTRRRVKPNVLAAFDVGTVVQELEESLLVVWNDVGKSYPEVIVDGYGVGS